MDVKRDAGLRIETMEATMDSPGTVIDSSANLYRVRMQNDPGHLHKDNRHSTTILQRVTYNLSKKFVQWP